MLVVICFLPWFGGLGSPLRQILPVYLRVMQLVSYCSLLMRASYRGVDLNVVIQRPAIRQVVTEPQNLTPSMM